MFVSEVKWYLYAGLETTELTCVYPLCTCQPRLQPGTMPVRATPNEIATQQRRAAVFRASLKRDEDTRGITRTPWSNFDGGHTHGTFVAPALSPVPAPRRVSTAVIAHVFSLPYFFGLAYLQSLAVVNRAFHCKIIVNCAV